MRSLLGLLVLVGASARADTSAQARDRELIFADGTRVCVARDARMHSAEGTALRSISFGREVEVLRRRDREWYEVRIADEPYIAWMSREALTPFCVRGDLDGDGRAADVASIYIDEDGFLHVRSRVGGVVANGVLHVAEPNDFAKGGRIYEAKLLGREVAGIPLVAVEADTMRCCQSFVKYLSFAPHDIRHALTVRDPVRFDAVARTAVVSGSDGTTRFRLEGRIYRPVGSGL
jgi:hypothetical protein